MINKHQSIMLAMSGILLAAAFPALAQIDYSAGDLLVNFRVETAQSDSDVTIDLGPVSTFDSTSGTTTVIGAGGLYSDAELLNGLGVSSIVGVGFSAVAEVANGSSDNTWETRVQSGTSNPGQVGTVATITTVNDKTAGLAIAAIGQGASSLNGTAISGNLNGSTVGPEGTPGTVNPSGVSVASGQADSYQGQGSIGGVINYNHGFTVSGANTAVENTITTSGQTVYSGLWTTPVSTTPTYDGYFTFDADGNGELQYTSLTATPEPSTYMLLGVTGVFGLVFRRRIGALLAS